MHDVEGVLGNQGPFVIRPARPGDAEAIAHVHVETWQAAYRGLVPDEHLDSLDVDARAERWLRLLSEDEPGPSVGVVDRPVLVAVIDAVVVGFATGGPEQWDRHIGAARSELIGGAQVSEIRMVRPPG
jgi:hypothetical protein